MSRCLAVWVALNIPAATPTMRHSHSLPAGRWPWAAAACPDQATTMTPASTSTAPPARRGVRGICWARARWMREAMSRAFKVQPPQWTMAA